MSQTTEVKVPDIGDFKDIPVIEVLVKPGDQVQKEAALITLESDKATMDVPSPQAGTVKEVKVATGDKVSEGSLVLLLETADEPATAAPAPQAQAAPPSIAPASSAGPVPTAAQPEEIPPPRPRTAPTASLEPIEEGFRKAHASPGVRAFARELGVDLGRVAGTGPKERILKEDVQGFVKKSLAGGSPGVAGAGPGLSLLPWPSVDFAKFGAVETQPLSRIKKLSGANLARNWVMIPHVTHNDDADITDLEALRLQLNREQEKAGIKVTMLAFLIKACVAALRKYPEFNASLDASAENLVLKRYYHIGFAADTPNGLVVPVVKSADAKGVVQIAKETSELAAKAREGKLAPGDMQGGTFSISSLGGIGGTSFTPIINAPEVAILGVTRSVTKPVWDGEAFVPRLVLPLSLSYDHRVIDGAAAARFTAHLAHLLADMRRALL
jgi:pyruvate dehydrogenase E2 component (dihydrolipoamide acetyltransferase)